MWIHSIIRFTFPKVKLFPKSHFFFSSAIYITVRETDTELPYAGSLPNTHDSQDQNGGEAGSQKHSAGPPQE